LVEESYERRISLLFVLCLCQETINVVLKSGERRRRPGERERERTGKWVALTEKNDNFIGPAQRDE
jgi:hypothetical protein